MKAINCLEANPIVSVILPFFNAEDTLQNAIESIASQSFMDFECILIDNDSTDKSAETTRDFVRKDHRFRLINESKQGVVNAFKKGYEISLGKYIARMDADDIADRNRLLMQCKYLEDNQDIDAVATQAEYFGDIPVADGFKRYVDWNNSLVESCQISVSRFIEMPVINPTLMWRKETSEKWGIYHEGDFPEDYEMLLRWLDNDVSIAKIDQKLLKWRDSESRLTRTDERYSEDAFYHLKMQYLLLWLTKNNPHHPDVLVWGASKISRKRVKYLEEVNINIRSYIDITTKRKLDKEVLNYKKIAEKNNVFILVFMKNEDIRDKIEKYLKKKGFTAGENYLLIS